MSTDNVLDRLRDANLSPALAKQVLLVPLNQIKGKPLHTIENMGVYVWIYLQVKENPTVAPLLSTEPDLIELSRYYERYAFAFHLWTDRARARHFVKATNRPEFVSTNFPETHYVCMVCDGLIAREIAQQGPSLERIMMQIGRHVAEHHPLPPVEAKKEGEP